MSIAKNKEPIEVEEEEYPDRHKINIKGSCFVVDHAEQVIQHELHSDEDSLRLVSLGRILEGKTSIYGVPLHLD